MARPQDEPKAKPTNDAYTGMLAVSLAALLIGTAFLYLDYSRYSDKPPNKVDMSFRERPAADRVEPKNARPPEENPDKKEDKDGGGQ